jgi:hypothetical protein
VSSELSRKIQVGPEEFATVRQHFESLSIRKSRKSFWLSAIFSAGPLHYWVIKCFKRVAQALCRALCLPHDKRPDESGRAGHDYPRHISPAVL